MWFLSGVGEVPTLNVCLDVWSCVESYRILMLLACRLKTMSTSNLKLKISFLVLLIVLLSIQKFLSLIASTRQALLILRVYLRLANRPSSQFANSTYKKDLHTTGTDAAFLSSQEIVLVSWVSAVAFLEQEPPSFSPYYLLNARNQAKLLPTSYIGGSISNGSSTKLCVPPLRN